MKTQIKDNSFQISVRRPTNEECYDVGYAEHLEACAGTKTKSYDFDRWLILEFKDDLSSFVIGTNRWGCKSSNSIQNMNQWEKGLVSKILRRFSAEDSIFFSEDYPNQRDLRWISQENSDQNFQGHVNFEKYDPEDFSNAVIRKITYNPYSNLVAIYNHIPEKLSKDQNPLYLLGVPRKTFGATTSVTHFGEKGVFLEQELDKSEKIAA